MRNEQFRLSNKFPLKSESVTKQGDDWAQASVWVWSWASISQADSLDTCGVSSTHYKKCKILTLMLLINKNVCMIWINWTRRLPYNKGLPGFVFTSELCPLIPSKLCFPICWLWCISGSQTQQQLSKNNKWIQNASHVVKYFCPLILFQWTT